MNLPVDFKMKSQQLTQLLSKTFQHLQITRNFTHNSSFIKIVEVGARDGLQNEPRLVPTDVKINLINQLSNTGLKSIEVTSFVSPKWVPQMVDNKDVFNGITKVPGVSYPVLVPNLKGLETAVAVEGVKEIAVFASASDGFSRKNVNCTAEESLNKIKDVIDSAKKRNLLIRGYVSCVVGCPYDGFIKPAIVTKITTALLQMGCYEVSLGDTIGVGTKMNINNMMKDLLKTVPVEKLAIHCHDTYGQALVNICTALEHGVTVVDSSVSGLGGCPYAKGASGNASTEDVIYMLNGMGLETGVNLENLVKAGNYISNFLEKPSESRANKALYQKYKL